jgi:hypothetical protein
VIGVCEINEFRRNYELLRKNRNVEGPTKNERPIRRGERNPDGSGKNKGEDPRGKVVYSHTPLLLNPLSPPH